MLILDIPSTTLGLLGVLLATLFFLHSSRLMRGGGASGFRQKDDDDYITGKKYNENIGSLSTSMEDIRRRVRSFVQVWQVVFFAYALAAVLILYWGYLSKLQVVERLERIEARLANPVR